MFTTRQLMLVTTNVSCAGMYTHCYNNLSINFNYVALSGPSESEEDQVFDHSEEEWIDDEDLSKSLEHDIGEDSEPEYIPVQNVPPQSLKVAYLAFF